MMISDDAVAGQVALVTGGGGAATGSATCRTLASMGASVAVLDNHHRRAEAVAAEIREEFGVPSIAVVADLGVRSELDAALELVGADLGPVDILVNNAAENTQGSIFDYRPEDWDRVIAVDLTACWYLIRQTIGGMRDRRRGSIVNVTSVAAYIGGRGREAPYAAAKAALHDLTRAVAIEGGPFGIRCNAVAPGLISSRWVEAHAERYAPFIDETPLRRNAEPDDVANAIAFLVSRASAHITGHVLNVSGGWYLTP